MKSFEISRIVNGEEITAVVTYNYPGEFSIKLVDDEFEGYAVSAHVMIMALAHRRYISPNGTLTEVGEEYANEYIENLVKARNLYRENREQIIKAIEHTIESHKNIVETTSKQLNNLYEKRLRMKNLFKSNGLNQKDYMVIKNLLDDKIWHINQKNKDLKFEILNRRLGVIEDLKPLFAEKCNRVLSAIKCHCAIKMGK